MIEFLKSALWLAVVLVLVSPSLQAQSIKYKTYPDAYREFMEEDRPMLVIVTASWCTACTQLKARLASVARPDGLNIALVDFDQENKLARALLLDAKTLPKTSLFYKDRVKGDSRVLPFTDVSTNSQLRSFMNDARIKYPTKSDRVGKD